MALLIIVSTVLCIILIGCGRGNVLSDEKVKMQDWLKEKYGKEFIVDSIDYYTQYLGAPKEIKGIIYPIDDKDLKFEIKKFADGGTYAPDNSLYLETYYKYLWEKQYNNQIRNIIKSDYLTIDISAPYATFDKEVKGRTLSIDEAKEIYNKSISIYLTYALFTDSEGKNIFLTKEKERIYSEIEKLKDDRFKEITLRIVYFSNDFKNKINKNSPFKFYTDGTYNSIKNEGNIIREVTIDNINEIGQYTDLSKHIEIKN
jgi:hypothetical protein